MSRAKNKQSPPSRITSLPEDIVVDILARVRTCDYPRVSLVSKRFRSLVSSAEIYSRRYSLGYTEHCLYLILYDKDNKNNRLYTLRRKDNNGNCSRRLVLIPGLPDMPRHASFVAVGSRIYVFCGINSFIIDCTSHTVQPLPSMPVPMSNIVSAVIGGRIYVFGYHGTDPESVAILVFDTETQTWEDGMTKPVMEMSLCFLVVMADKMYVMGYENSYVYDPKESKWETDEVLDSKTWENACVVDDVLYFYDFRGKELRVYDPEHKCWGVVNGLDDLKMRRVGCYWTRTVSYAGKLVLFFRKQKIIWEICYAEISLERRKGGQIWGKVDQWSSDHASTAGRLYIMKSLDVVV
ncbi:F-box/kelch-repeat protein [Raphanus sativus]|uniref:F-box/kelch-repeat protein At4g38940-like n=1 Tax=Raphanus sativus TaxID=3726 RepID=A0A6J0M5H6_RAPSA|nr:F-box/kelch-repeat protein At4g38940-like [Raphanus sativus]KAJ4884173.1 F-box/kelch-repeat protein [Raphanus sativus]